MLLSYDTEKLELQDGVTGISDCQVSAKNGTVEITRYGNELSIPAILNAYYTKSDLPDGNLTFLAYPLGKGNLSVKVILQNSNTSANGQVLESSDGKSYTAPLVFNEVSYKYYNVTFTHIPEGVRNGKATVVLDATAAGLGVMARGEVDILSGETVAAAVIEFLTLYGYSPTYDGSAENAFYLRKITSSDIGSCRWKTPPHPLGNSSISKASCLAPQLLL